MTATMRYSDFKLRLRGNLSTQGLTIEDVLHMPPFTQLDPPSQHAVITILHEAAHASCQKQGCVERALATAIESGWTPCQMLYFISGFLAKQAEEAAVEAMKEQAASAAKIEELNLKIEEHASKIAEQAGKIEEQHAKIEE